MNTLRLPWIGDLAMTVYDISGYVHEQASGLREFVQLQLFQI
jgi:hypothetical protein